MILIKQGRIQGRKHKQDKEIHSLLLKSLILEEVIIIMNNCCTKSSIFHEAKWQEVQGKCMDVY